MQELTTQLQLAVKEMRLVFVPVLVGQPFLVLLLLQMVEALQQPGDNRIQVQVEH
jgi:hypothetical protein